MGKDKQTVTTSNEEVLALSTTKATKQREPDPNLHEIKRDPKRFGEECKTPQGYAGSGKRPPKPKWPIDPQKVLPPSVRAEEEAREQSNHPL